MIGLIIYLVGVVLCYMLCRYNGVKHDLRDWGYVVISFFVSTLSFIGVVVMILVIIIEYLEYKYPEPPKWL